MSSKILTSTGIWFDVLNPNPSNIAIEDIAAALSKLCRFGGHCRSFYSVAEHSCNAAKLALAYGLPQETAIWALLHDASEAYVVDIPRPVKRQLKDYDAIESRIQEAVATKFGLPWPMPDDVHDLDMTMLAVELRQYMPVQDESLLPALPNLPSGFELRATPLLPDQAAGLFSEMLQALGATKGVW